jgi:hypothetical protein
MSCLVPFLSLLRGASDAAARRRVVVADGGGEVCVPVDLAETADTDGLAHVDVAGDGGGANVEPVNVLGGQLVGVYAALDGGLRGGGGSAAARARRFVFMGGTYAKS